MTSTIRYMIIGAILGAFACLAVTFAGCATTGAVIATVKDCANEVTHSTALGIIDDVSAVLICDAGNAETLPACVVSQLEVIAKKAGWMAIDCAIAEIQKKSADNVNASSDPTELIRLRRANASAVARAAGKLGPAS